MTKREFLDIVFALAPNEANAIMDAFDEYVESNEPHWIPVEQALPEQDKICLVCGKNGGIYVARFWRNENIVLWTKTGTGKFVNAVAWMPLPEPYKGVTT